MKACTLWQTLFLTRCVACNHTPYHAIPQSLLTLHATHILVTAYTGMHSYLAVMVTIMQVVWNITNSQVSCMVDNYNYYTHDILTT